MASTDTRQTVNSKKIGLPIYSSAFARESDSLSFFDFILVGIVSPLVAESLGIAYVLVERFEGRPKPGNVVVVA